MAYLSESAGWLLAGSALLASCLYLAARAWARYRAYRARVRQFDPGRWLAARHLLWWACMWLMLRLDRLSDPDVRSHGQGLIAWVWVRARRAQIWCERPWVRPEP